MIPLINSSGYAHPLYAASLSEFGDPFFLPNCGGWILKRQIPGTQFQDAMGCYPMFMCQDWAALMQDLQTLETDLISVALVTDPFGDYEVGDLNRYFKDRVIPFKQHFLIDLHKPLEEIGSRHHRRQAFKALKKIRVEVCESPLQILDTWTNLYSQLIKKHHITGIKAFSKDAFYKQFCIPNTIVLQAVYEGEVIAAQIYFPHNQVIHCHLGASLQIGYKLGAFYALDWFSIEHFTGKARWLDLGGGVGLSADGSAGLSEYKFGWANDFKTTYFCGRILNPTKYDEIVKTKNLSQTDYFPAYRKGEFG